MGNYKTFKQYLKMIAEAKNQEDATDHVFYGPDGIDQAYQHGKLTAGDHELLLTIICKLA